MPQLGRGLRTGMLVGVALLLAACGREAEREAETAAAPVRQIVARLSNHPEWQGGAEKCFCVGMFRGDVVEDFPAGLLAAEFSRHRWLRNWSECEQHYGRATRLKGCGGGMTDYVCSVAERSDLPAGTSRVLCHAAGESKALQAEYLQDEYDVTRNDNTLVVRPVGQKATAKLLAPLHP